jgi:hypothetical protein
MAGGRIARAQAVRGLFWTMALLLGVLWYIPADLPPPPPPRASSSFVLPSRCVPTLCHGQMMLLLCNHLFVTIFTCVFLTVKTEALMLSVGGIRNQALRIPKIKECLSLPKFLCERPSSETPGALESFLSFRTRFSAHILHRQ